MGDVTDFPGGRHRPAMPPPVDVWASPELRERDADYVLAVLKARLPPEALRHVAGLDLASIARAVVLEVDTVRHGRRFDPRYDERRAGGEALALAELFGSPPRPTQPTSAEPPSPSEPDEFPWQMRREAEALDRMWKPPPPEPEGAA